MLCSIAGGAPGWGGVVEVVCVVCKPHEPGICVGAARLCAPTHASFSFDDVDSPFLYLPAVQTVHVGAAVVVPPFSVNLPAAHLVCSAASQGAREGGGVTDRMVWHTVLRIWST